MAEDTFEAGWNAARAQAQTRGSVLPYEAPVLPPKKASAKKKVTKKRAAKKKVV